MNRFIHSVGSLSTMTTMLSFLTSAPSFITPVLSSQVSSLKRAKVLEYPDTNFFASDTDSLSSKEWLLNLRGGKDSNGDDTESVGVSNQNGICDSNDHDSNDSTMTNNDAYSYRTVQVQVIHRHGDRTPITPLKNEEFWAQQLVPDDLLDRVSSGTRVLRNQDNNVDSGKNKLEVHAASGRGPFGKLTKLGLFGMIQVGTDLKEALEGSTLWSETCTASKTIDTRSTGAGLDEGKKIGGANGRRIEFTPKDIKVYSTDFARTIQSVQGLLVGFFPDGISTNQTIDIDCRDTVSWMIPDPQPRQTKEQEVLERELAKRPYVLEREASMRPLAVRCTNSLLPLLGQDAFDVSFGVEDNEVDDVGKKEEHPTLPWIQLAEITKCLRVRDMLPDSISADDQESLLAHTAWKWFQSLRSPRLSYLSMRRFTDTIVKTLQKREEEPPLVVYSCHDSSLIGLLCALHLEQPSVWPEYGAVLKVELLEKKKEGPGHVETTHVGDDSGEPHYVLRFSLNGELLRSMWHDIAREEISMDEFIQLISTAGDNTTLN